MGRLIREVLTGFAQGLLIVGVAIVLNAFVGVPLGVALAVAFVGLFIARARRAKRLVSRAPRQPVPCPRCDVRLRTASGWCEPCTGDLLSSPLPPPGHPFERYCNAMLRRDFVAASGCVTDPFVLRVGGRTMSRSAALVRRGGRVVSILYPRRRSTTLIATALDPREQDIVWSHTHDRARGLPGLGQLNANLVVQFRYDGDRIKEMTYAPPLPE